MPPKLPQISGPRLLKLLVKLGYEIIRQRDSHIRLRKSTKTGEHKLTVSLHRTVAKGTLHGSSLTFRNIRRRLGMASAQLPAGSFQVQAPLGAQGGGLAPFP